jgi:hypothetical protein
MVASILSKKLAAGSTRLLIDLPVGPTAKLVNEMEAMRLRKLFEFVGDHYGISVEVVVTDGRQQAFGFDLSPLVVRSEEFESLAAAVEAEARAIKLARERITLCRRDIAKMIATGIEEGVPTRRVGQGPADWAEVHAGFRSIVEAIPRTATRAQLEAAAEELSQLADDVLNLLETHVKTRDMSGNESRSERHIQKFKSRPLN